MGQRSVVLTLILGVFLGCGADPVPPEPFELMEGIAWRAVNRSNEGADGIFVQAELRTFAYEIANAYARAAREGLSQEQLEYRLRQVIYSYVDGTYPLADGTDINNLFYQYLVYVNPQFDNANPLQRRIFDNWRGEFVRRLIDRVYDPKWPVLRNHYDERWGVTLFSRLVFIVYLKNEGDGPPLSVADIGTRTFLVDESGRRYAPSGNDGPYLYDTDRPAGNVLHDELVYRVVFPNRQRDRQRPIITPDTQALALEIEGLGSVPVRRLEWQLPLIYPELPQRRLYSERDWVRGRSMRSGSTP